MPIVRTFAPILAGVGRMNFREFFFTTWLAVFCGHSDSCSEDFSWGAVPDVDRYILPIVLVIIVLFFLARYCQISTGKETHDAGKDESENRENK